MKKLALLLPLLLAFSAPSVQAAKATKADAQKAILAAVLENNKARKARFEWRDTYKKLLGPAKKAYKEGDYDKAVKLSNTAIAHAKLGQAQAKSQAKADLIK